MTAGGGGGDGGGWIGDGGEGCIGGAGGGGDGRTGWIGRAALRGERPDSEAILRASAEQAECERDGEFGSPDSIIVERLDLPRFGLVILWRSDGYLGEFDGDHSRVDEVAADLDSDAWGPWELSQHGYTSGGEVNPGDRADPTWWLVWGLARPAELVTSWLADDTDVAVSRLGGIWFAEYESVTQPLFVGIDGMVAHEITMMRPAYLPAPRVPFVRSAPNPRA